MSTNGLPNAATPTTTEPSTSPEDPYQSLLRSIALGLNLTLSNPTVAGSLSLSYITEGAANVIWNIHFHSSDSTLSALYSSLVLRMRKDIPSTTPMLGLKSQYEDRIAPLFTFNPSLLLPVTLVELTPGIVEDLNVQLHSLEERGVRRESRRGIYLPEFEVEQYAMLMPNLSHGDGELVEFKPKWLAQSPSAPNDARRCRTCALNGRRREKGGSGRGDSGFCPFDLLSSDEKILSGALGSIWKNQESLMEFVRVFKDEVQPALRQIQQLHREHGEVGLDDFLDPVRKDFSVAMALRDCSIVLKVVRSSGGQDLDIPSVKLLDLDLKDTGGGKLEKWAKMERELIEEGWYTTRPAPSIQCAVAYQ